MTTWPKPDAIAATLLDQLKTILVARISMDGQVLYANRGILKLVKLESPLPSWEIRALFKQPTWHQIQTEINQHAEFKGKIHVGSGESEYLTLQAHIWQENADLLFVAEHDIEGLRQLNTAVLDLNEELAETQRELARNEHALRSAQMRAFQTEKLTSLAQLAAGLAHEINTPLGYINSNLRTLEQYIDELLKLIESYTRAESAIADHALQLTLKDARDSADLEFLQEDVQALVSESREGVSQIGAVIQCLRDISQVDNAAIQWVDIGKALDRSLELIKTEIPDSVQVKKMYGEIPEIQCRPAEINLVILNLLRNALDAMGGKGKLTVATGQQDKMILIRITDTGVGIDPTLANRIFEPFFTTKSVGKGKGLGLTLAYDIIRDHQGRITVEPQVGRGTTFKVWLPCEYLAPVKEQDSIDIPKQPGHE